MEFVVGWHLKRKTNSMKPILNLSIPNPCAEKWDNFKPTAEGGFCGTCNSVVTDFTKMTDQEISNFLETNPVHVCGRLRPDQMKSYGNWQTAKVSPGLALLRSGLVCLFFVLSSQLSFAQTPKPQTETIPGAVATATNDVVVNGTVEDETGAPMPGVNVYLRNSGKGTITDASGKFEFPDKLKDGDLLTFSFIGYESVEYVVRRNEEGLINLKMSLGDVEIMGEVVVGKVYSTKTGVRRWWSGVRNLF